MKKALRLPIVMGVVAAGLAARCLSAADHFPTSYSPPGEIAAKWAMILVLIVIVAAMGLIIIEPEENKFEKPLEDLTVSFPQEESNK